MKIFDFVLQMLNFTGVIAFYGYGDLVGEWYVL